MRKYKIVKRKELIFDMEEWAKVEQRAAAVNMKTATFIQRMAVDGKVLKLEVPENRKILLELNRIGNSLNQLARKANEINSVYAVDIEKIKEEHEQLCLILNQYVSTLRLNDV